jgi:hypothetical protein
MKKWVEISFSGLFPAGATRLMNEVIESLENSGYEIIDVCREENIMTVDTTAIENEPHAKRVVKDELFPAEKTSLRISRKNEKRKN